MLRRLLDSPWLYFGAAALLLVAALVTQFDVSVPSRSRATPDELAQCAPFLHRQVELVNPKLLVTLGNVPTQALFATSQGITRMRGQWKTLEINAWQGAALPTLHPAFLLRTPSAKAQAWKDMLSLKAAMAREGLVA